MKKHALILCLLLLHLFATAQTLHLGAGLTYSKLDWVFKDVMMTDGERHFSAPLIGYSFNIGLEYLEFKKISVTTNLMFYESGGKNTEAEKSNQGYIFQEPNDVRIDYLSLGTTFNYYPIKDKLSLCLSIGPRFDLIESDLDVSPLNWIDMNDGVVKTNYGFTAGSGLSYARGDFKFGIEGMYLWKARKLVDLKPGYSHFGFTPGAEASEQIFLFNFTFAWRIRQYQE
jgi:hypothetical protein